MGVCTAVSERTLSAVADGCWGVDVGVEAWADVGIDVGVGADAAGEGSSGGSEFAVADSSMDFRGGAGFRARFVDEFSQKEILAVPLACRTVCRCNGHCPR